ncbi:MAG: T9SS type A sorting domain-containing protein [Bacteroidales bacterium]|nr:T9SS type A sorting domain-containing protein [Candidatus Colimorpha onthohippi]
MTLRFAAKVSSFYRLFLFFGVLFGTVGLVQAQKTVTPAGGDVKVPGVGSLSVTFGQPADMIFSSTKMPNEGVQQPYLHNHDTVEATVCQGMAYSSGLFAIASAQTAQVGVFYFDTTLRDANLFGGDSIVTLKLTVLPTISVTIKDTACDQFLWGTQLLTSSGSFDSTFHTQQGCDSVVTLNLTINQSNAGIATFTACDSFEWHGTKYYAANTTDTIHARNIDGCDSVVTLNLTLNHSNTGDTTAVACDSFVWHGKKLLLTNNTDTIHARNAAGCDSVVTLNLTLNHSNTGDTTAVACDSFVWHGKKLLLTNNTDTIHARNIEGCDSVVTLNLTINHSNTGIATFTACDSFEWNGKKYYADNMTDTMHAVNATHCDSIVTLNLTLNSSISQNEVLTVNENELPYDWRDTTFGAGSQDSIHHFYRKTAQLCDSVVTLTFSVNRNGHYHRYEVACDSFSWDDNPTATVYKASGNYDSLFTTASGTDSVVTLHLTLRYSKTGDTIATACDSFSWHGITYKHSQTPTFSDVTSDGCDSIVTLRLTVYNSVAQSENLVVDENDLPYTWRDTTFAEGSQDSVHHFYRKTINQCDSTVTLTFSVNRNGHYNRYEVACDSFLWDGNPAAVYKSSGDYDSTFMAFNGTDSVVTLHLTINHSATGDTIANVCDSFKWHGITYVNSQLPTSKEVSANGCDSIVTLHLTVNNSIYVDTLAIACDSFLWHDVVYYNSANPKDTSSTAAGCDSIVTLHLVVNHKVETTIDSSICFSQLVFTWNNKQFSSAGRDTAHLVAENGCDSIVTMVVKVKQTYNIPQSRSICASELPYTWNDVVFTASGSKNDTLSTIDNCDSVVAMTLFVKDEQHNVYVKEACDSFVWDNNGVVLRYATLGVIEDTHSYLLSNGCYGVDTLRLTLHAHSAHNITVTSCDYYTWDRDGVKYLADTTTYYRYTDSNGCASADTLMLRINYNSNMPHIVTACDSFEWICHGSYVGTYSHDTTKTFAYQNEDGCYSVDTLYLTITSGTYRSAVVDVCDSFRWTADTLNTHGTGLRYIEGGQYLSGYHNEDDCPSVDTLHLTLRYATSEARSAFACDSFVWVNRQDTLPTYFASGSYTHPYLAENGCPSADTLRLTLGYTNTAIDNKVTCDSLWWNGNWYSKSTYTPTYTCLNSSGCDSTVTLHLTLAYSTSATVIVRACGSYFWNDSLYTSSTQDVFHSYSAEGCDSNTYLSLEIYPVVDTIVEVAACEHYKWHGVTYRTSTDEPRVLLSDIHGCDSLVNLHLTINHNSTAHLEAQAADYYNYKSKQYFYSGEYVDTLTNSVGCDSLVVLNLSIIHNKPLPEIQAYGNQTVMINHFPNGTNLPRVDYLAYRWYRDGKRISGATDDYFANAGYAALNGTYYCEVPTDESRQYWVRSNSITFGAVKGSIVDMTSPQLELYPNPVAQNHNLTVVLAQKADELLEGSTLTLYDLQGRMHYTMPVTNIVHTLQASYPAGVYTLVYQISDSQLKAIKVIIK